MSKKKNTKKWYQSVSNWFMIVACMILIPVLLVNLYIIFQSNTNKDKVPSIFGYKPFIVLSGSMESDIHKGDLIITKEVKHPENLKKEDVIAFRDAEGTVTTHRIIDIVEKDGNKYFITKGDNNSTQDRNLVSLDKVEGIYVGRIAGVGNFMNWLAEPMTLVVLALGITVIFVVGFMISTKKQQSEEQKEFLEYKKMKALEAKKETKEKESDEEESED